ELLNVITTVSNAAILTNLTVHYSRPAATGSLTFNTVSNAFGTAHITVTVNDGGTSNNVVARSFNVTLTSANDPPVISAIADLATDEDLPTAPLAFTVADVESAATSLNVQASSSNPTLLPTNNIVLGGLANARTVTLQPTLN